MLLILAVVSWILYAMTKTTETAPVRCRAAPRPRPKWVAVVRVRGKVEEVVINRESEGEALKYLLQKGIEPRSILELGRR